MLVRNEKIFEENLLQSQTVHSIGCAANSTLNAIFVVDNFEDIWDIFLIVLRFLETEKVLVNSDQRTKKTC